MSDPVMETRIRNLEALVEELQAKLRSAGGIQDQLLANGLDDMLTGHGNQRFGVNAEHRISAEGWQIKHTVEDASQFFVSEFFNGAVPATDGVMFTGFSDGTQSAYGVLATNNMSVASLPLSDYGAEMRVTQNAAGGTQGLAHLAAISVGQQIYLRVYATTTGTRIYCTGPFRLGQDSADFTLVNGQSEGVDGDLWYRTDLDKIRARINGVTENLATESYGAATYAPIAADYLVGTSNGSLTGEIVVGATPGGELGGTWGSPTVDASHSGSTHAATQAAAEATAAAALTAHEGAADPHTGYILESLVDAKGDLLTATADNTPARLAVGATDGHVLTVDATQATGMKWAAATGSGVSIGLDLALNNGWGEF